MYDITTPKTVTEGGHLNKGWEHINLTGDYQWQGKRLAQGRFRPLRIPNPA